MHVFMVCFVWIVRALFFPPSIEIERERVYGGIQIFTASWMNMQTSFGTGFSSKNGIFIELYDGFWWQTTRVLLSLFRKRNSFFSKTVPNHRFFSGFSNLHHLGLHYNCHCLVWFGCLCFKSVFMHDWRLHFILYFSPSHCTNFFSVSKQWNW